MASSYEQAQQVVTEVAAVQAAASNALSAARALEAALAPKPESPVPTPSPEPVPSTATFRGRSASNPMPVGETPGATSSPWNTRKGAVLSNSPSLVTALLTGVSPPNVGFTPNWMHPTYYASNSDPVVEIRNTETGWGSAFVALNGVKIRVPAQAKPAPEADAHMSVVLCPDDCTKLGRPLGTSAQMWAAQAPTGGKLTSRTGSWGNIAGSLCGSRATAGGFDGEAGVIRAVELAPVSSSSFQTIRHALFATSHNISSAFKFPAEHSDGHSTIANAPAMGQRFALEYSTAEIAALAVPVPVKAVLWALSEYGLILGDSGGPGLGLQVECSTMFTAFGLPDPFQAVQSRFGVSSLNTTSADWKGRLRAVA